MNAFLKISHYINSHSFIANAGFVVCVLIIIKFSRKPLYIALRRKLIEIFREIKASLGELKQQYKRKDDMIHYHETMTTYTEKEISEAYTNYDKAIEEANRKVKYMKSEHDKAVKRAKKNTEKHHIASITNDILKSLEDGLREKMLRMSDKDHEAIILQESEKLKR
ncbi:hypothetical protein Fsol_00061 [Candidatus Fokinia solitaria]|uniref:Uncharacterized protein n=1 Tax=Candidatus Fokinia solitaria TaxID=1802984 RepID=A0A2U8BRA7_9RICK|nr:hypothetical protein [Candidatus Fokinia solitaria]AWD32874.1 hypothetical protein Fsol_00061 [Candidatus Fokinia solitaria]